MNIFRQATIFCLVLLLVTLGGAGCGEPRTGKIQVGGPSKGSNQCKPTAPRNEIIVNFEFKNKSNPRLLRVYFWNDLVYDECTDVKTKYEYIPKVSRRGTKAIDMVASFPNEIALPASFKFTLENVTNCDKDEVEKLYFLDFLLEPIVKKPGPSCTGHQLAKYIIKG